MCSQLPFLSEWKWFDLEVVRCLILLTDPKVAIMLVELDYDCVNVQWGHRYLIYKLSLNKIVLLSIWLDFKTRIVSIWFDWTLKLGLFLFDLTGPQKFKLGMFFIFLTNLDYVVVVGKLQLVSDGIVAVVGRRLEGVLLGDVRASVLSRLHRGPEVGSAVQKPSSATVKLRKVIH